jgi:hypothetical protein
MKKTHKIGWQKYEDVIESQITSPIIDQLYSALLKRNTIADDDIIDELEGINIEELDKHLIQEVPPAINIDENLANEIALAINFDCWIAHTNFNITLDIKNNLDRIEGVELLKVFSRYRFLVGVGRMFDFSDVRKKIEDMCNKPETKE